MNHSEAAKALIASIQEKQRLRQLSGPRLIAEVLSSDAADELAVAELMDRVLPGWEENAEVRELVGDVDDLGDLTKPTE